MPRHSILCINFRCDKKKKTRHARETIWLTSATLDLGCVATQPRSASDDDVFALSLRDLSLPLGKSSRTAAFGALGSRSDVRDEISSTSDFDLLRRARSKRRGRANIARASSRIHACVRVYARPRMRAHNTLWEPGSPDAWNVSILGVEYQHANSQGVITCSNKFQSFLYKQV